MTDADMIRAIAEFDGNKPKVVDGLIMCGDGAPIQNYLTSLDAIVPVTEKLAPEQRATFLYYFPSDRFEAVNATARQRCEALLRTLGRWQEDKP